MDSDYLNGLVSFMQLYPLNTQTFKDFSNDVNRFFVPGARYIEYFSPGYNSNSSTKYDFGSGKPDWRMKREIVYERVEHRSLPDRIWMNVHFEETPRYPRVWGAENGFRVGVLHPFALYVAELEGSGTTDFPWEEMIVRLE